MTLPVSLREVVDELESQPDEGRFYLNCRTGELVYLSSEELAFAEEECTEEDLGDYPAWQHDSLRKAIEVMEDEDFLMLPDKFHFHDWNIMKDFCYEKPNRADRDRLLNCIHSRGAFSRFKDELDDEELQEWYRYKTNAYADVAREWLNENEIAFNEDLK